MGETTKIEWCDATWNPWIGCTRVSQGCVNCYAESFAKRYGKAEWGPTAERVRTSAANWRKPLTWNKAKWEQCRLCGWRGPTSDTHNFCPNCDNEMPEGVRR